MIDVFTEFNNMGEAQEVEFALKRNGFTHVQLKKLTSGSMLGDIREVLEGRAEICRIKRLAGVTSATPKRFPIWKTLTIGGLSRKEFQKRLDNGKFFTSDWAKDIMGKPAFKTSAEAHEASFVRVKVGDLGFTELPTTTELFDRDRLAAFGLERCEPEDGPALRLALPDQPIGDYLWVGMEPIIDSGADPDVFYVGRSVDGERWLSARCAHPSHRWDLSGGVVFRFRK